MSDINNISYRISYICLGKATYLILDIFYHLLCFIFKLT